MPFHFESYMARRYLRGAEGKAEGRRFLRLITWIAVGGVSVGVAALILALSVVRGFSGEIQNKITGFAAHVQVQSIRDEPLDDAQRLTSVLVSQDGVVDVMPVIQEFILLRRSARDIDGVSLVGMDQPPAYIRETLVSGNADLVSQEGSDTAPVVIGAELARNLGVSIGGRLTAFAVQGAGGGMSQSPRVVSLQVAGIYETSLADFDALQVFVDINVARDLLEYGPDQVTRLDLHVGEGRDFTTIADQLDQVLDFPAIARPVTDIYRSLYAWVALQQSIIPLIISIIVFVAAVNIIGTLLMIILEKNREMGILASMGATSRSRSRIFLRLGLLIGMMGVMIGEGSALILAWAQQQFGLIPLPAEAYYMSTAPVDMSPLDFVAVAVVTLLLCALSSWIPARYAGRVQPIHAITIR